MAGGTNGDPDANPQQRITDPEGTKRNEEIFEDKLDRELKIRDSIHGDVWVTNLEKQILDHPQAQRLKRIRQLGMTHFVYPGANHTRFEHSLGTLHLAQRIIDSVKRNHKRGLSEETIEPEDEFVTRIVALIHDLAHLPFGHTLEDQGGLFNDNQWTDDDRKELLFEKQIEPIIRNELSSLREQTLETVSQRILDTLDAEEEGEEDIANLDRPYIADIVGNTICADLLDYVIRDSYYTGLNITYDEDLFSRFVIVDYDHEPTDDDIKTKPRLGIHIEDDNGNLRRSIVSDCVELLRRRYTLAEKVHTDSSKEKFSAMVIRAVHCAKQAGVISKEDLLDIGDDVLIHRLANLDLTNEKTGYHRRAAKNLADGILSREKYKPYVERNLFRDQNLRSQVNRFAEPDHREDFARYLEEVYELEEGSVVIYAPDELSGKPAEAKMVRNGEPRKLKNLVEDDGLVGYKKQELDALERGFSRLRRFYIFIRDDYWKQMPVEKTKGREEAMRGVYEEYLDGDLYWTTKHKHDLMKARLGSDAIVNDDEVEEVYEEIVTSHDDPRAVDGIVDKVEDHLRK